MTFDEFGHTENAGAFLAAIDDDGAEPYLFAVFGVCDLARGHATTSTVLRMEKRCPGP